MPIYEYVCTSCGEPLEKLQKLSDAPLTDCPACGEARLKRKVSAAGFRLSGGGWYETDFKSDNRRNLTGEANTSNDSSAKSANSNASGDGAKKNSDSKPAESKNKTGGETKTTATPSKSSSAGNG